MGPVAAQSREAPAAPEIRVQASARRKIRAQEIARLGAVIDTLLALKQTEITGPSFVASDTQTTRDAALREATTSAHRQAVAMAEAGGVRLGPVLSLGAVPSYDDSYGINGGLGTVTTAAGAATPTTVVEPQVPVTVTDTGRWGISGP